MKQKLFFVALVFTFSIFTGCGDSEKEITPNKPDQIASVLDEYARAEIKMADGTKIEFREVQPGGVVVIASSSMDSPSSFDHSIIQKMIINKAPFTEIYKNLAGSSINKSYVKSLEEVDVRVKARALFSGLPENSIEELKSITGARTAAIDDAGPETPQCPDPNDNNFGASDFGTYLISKTITPPPGHPLPPNYDLKVGVNKTSIAETKSCVTFYTFAGQAADYSIGGKWFLQPANIPGSIRAGTLVNFAPRDKKTIYYGTSFNGDIVWFQGFIPCSRVHYGRVKDK